LPTGSRSALYGAPRFSISPARILFYAGWLRWYFALPCVALLVLGVIASLRSPEAEAADEQRPAIPAFQLWTVMALALLLASVSGAGGYGFQDTHWLTHNALLKGLIEQPWPPVCPIEGGSFPLVYYVAFYLPAAAVGKVAGWQVANHALFVWTLIGLVLAVQWAVLLIRPGHLIAAVVFVLFSGLYLVGVLVTDPWRIRFGSWDQIEWWAAHWQYSGNVTQVFYVPNQALAAWIVAGMTLHDLSKRKATPRAGFVLALLLLWSPFAFLGLLPFQLIELRGNRSLPTCLRTCLSTPNGCGAILAGVIALFYGSHFHRLGLESIAAPAEHGFVFVTNAVRSGDPASVPLLVVFYLVEFGLYALAIARAPVLRSCRKELGVAVAILLALTLYRYGYNNDLAMRASIPALFVLCVMVGRALLDPEFARARRLLVAALLCVGAFNSGVECRRHVRGIRQTGTLVSWVPQEDVPDLWTLYRTRYWGTGMVGNYLGSMEAPFFRLLAKPPRA